MPEPVQLAGLVLAAGDSTRMGTDKAMLPWPPPQPGNTVSPRHTLLSAALAAFDPFTRISIVVAGRNAESIADTVGASGAYLVRNPAPENGQFSSLQIGLRALLDCGCNAAMITPVDCPPLSPSSLDRLHYAFLGAASSGFWAVAPEHQGRHGHPLLAGRDLIEAFLETPITGTAREVLHANASRVVYVPVPDPLVKAGLNTPQDYAAGAASETSEI
jgi:molybdopterin-guanine dinucleotide biosynthesis protein A